MVEKEIVVEKVVEQIAPPPQPVIVKTIHDTTIVTEEPTDIHHVELSKPAAVVRSAPPPVRASVPAPAPEAAAAAGGFCTGRWWLCLLPLLCCLPLLCLPCLFCCPKKKHFPGPLIKPSKGQNVAKKEFVAKEQPQFRMEKVVERKKVPRATVRRVEEPQEDIEVEIERELQKKAIVEETVVVRKEVPVEEYETQVMRSNVEAEHVMRQ